MTDVPVETYEDSLLEGMVEVFNRETAAEPHIAPLSVQVFQDLVAAKSHFDPSGLLVAVSGSEVVGWVHACVAPPSEPWQDPEQTVGRIRMLIFPRADLRLGSALVSEATRWLRETELTEFEAINCSAGYPFYRGLWMGAEPMCPTGALPQVELALEVGGYKKQLESIMMTAKLDGPPPATGAAVELDLVETPATMAHEPMRESWTGFEPMTVQAMIGDEQVGSIGWVALPHVAQKLGSPCVNVWSLSVQEQHRRKGIASALLARALKLGYAEGARHASVGTQLWNVAAQATYSKFGYTPYCVVGGRSLQLSAGES